MQLQRETTNPKRNNLPFGKLGEDLACTLLTKSGYKIIDRNFSGKFGELDIIAIDGPTLVFIEVKTRKNLRFGYPQEAVTPQKIYRIKKTGEYYSLLHPELPKKIRIDVVALIIENNNLVYSKIIKVY